MAGRKAQYLMAGIWRGFLALGWLILFSLSHAQSPEPALPAEVDTVEVGQAVVLSNLSGEILRRGEGGVLMPIAGGESIEPGEMLLVRRGASFSIGGNTFGPESHGDRWVLFR